MSRLANHRTVPTDRGERRKTRYKALHEHNPAGSKLARRIAKVILRKQRAIEKRTTQEPETPKPRSKQISYERALVLAAKNHLHFQRTSRQGTEHDENTKRRPARR